MSKYKIVNLGDIAAVILGKKFISSEFNNKSGIPVIKVNNIQDNYVDLTDCDFVESPLGNINKRYQVYPGDLLISLSGSHINQPKSVVGKVAMYNDPETCLLNQRVAKIKPDEKLVNRFYLKAYLSQASIRQQLAFISKGASNQANISPKDVKKIQIKLPPFEVQQRIGNTLETIDQLLNNNSDRIAGYEAIADHLFQHYFGPYQSPNQFNSGKNDYLPAGWRISNLANVAHINKERIGKNFVGVIKYIDLSSVSKGKIGLITELDYKNAPAKAKLIVHKDDIIWSLIRPDREAYARIKENEKNLIVSNGFVTISPSIIPANYLYQFLRSKRFITYLNNKTLQSVVPYLTVKTFENAEIILPDEQTLNTFETLIDPINAIIFNLNQQNRLLYEAQKAFIKLSLP